MSKRDYRRVNLQDSKLGRRRQTRRSQALFEALEIRRLLSTYQFPNQSTPQANATELQGIINGTIQISSHTLTSGDILQISPSDQFLFTIGTGDTNSLVLPDRTDFAAGSTPITIETSDIGSLPSGRIGPSNLSDLVQFSGGDANNPIIQTATSAHDFKFIGIEIKPSSNTYSDEALVDIGTNSSTQNTVAEVPTDFTFDRCYITGLDFVGPVTINNGGAGYTAAPTVSISGGGGSGATGIANIENGAVNYVTITNAGSGYTADPTISFSGGGYTTPASATANYTPSGIAGVPANTVSGYGNNYVEGVNLNSMNTTVENCYISDIHHNAKDAQAIAGDNGPGNFLITNNFLEATGENIMFGGGTTYVYGPNGTNSAGLSPENIIITHNYFYKPLAWDKYSPEWDGNNYDVKNLLEFKEGISVTVEDNLFQNNWVGKDQVGEAITITPKNYVSNSWALDHDITIENNVIENVGEGVQFGADAPSTVNGTNYWSQPAYNITIDNNLFESITGEGVDNASIGMIVEGGLTGPAYNVTFQNNTLLGMKMPLEFTGAVSGDYGAISTGFVFENNIFNYGQYGVFSSAGDGTIALDEGASGITITNPGSDYTAAPTVSFNGGGGSGVTGKAIVSTNGAMLYVEITNAGSGYTAAPSVSFSGGGGSGAAATATETNGTVCGWNFAGNVILGMPTSQDSSYPSSATTGFNYYNDTDPDTTGFLDTAGDEYGLISGSTYYSDGTGGSTPGVNETSLLSAMGSSADFVPVDATLQNYWKFDAGSGTTDVDNGLGTHQTATLSSSSLWTISGEMNDAIALTGSSSGSVSVPSFTADASFTFAAWVNPTNFNATQYIASTKNSSSVSAFSLSINTSGQLVATGTAGSIPGSASTAIKSGQWSLVSVTFSSGTLTLYVNGAQVGSASSATTTSGSTTLYIGGNGGSVSSFNGTIDDVRYYSSALTASQLSWLYSGFGPYVGVGFGTAAVTTSTSGASAFALGHADDVMTSTGYQIPAPISFSWSENSGPTGVTFSVNNSNAAQNSVVTWPTSGNYYLELTVTDGLGGSTSTLIPVTVNLNSPAAPTNLTASPSGTNNVLAWTWSANGGPGINGFDVWVSQDGTDFTQLTSVASTVSSFTDTSETPGTFYYYEVTAYNTNGQSPDSNIVGLYDGSPAAPTNLSSIGAPSAVDLTWTSNSSGDAFYVYRSIAGDSSYSPVETTAVNATAWNDSGASANTVYDYYVEAFDSDGTSNPSNIVISQLLTPPDDITATSTSSSQMTVTWVDTSGGQGTFNLQYEDVNVGTWTQINNIPVGTTSYLLTGLNADAPYNVELEAVDSAGNSGWSSPASGRTFNTSASPNVYEGFNYSTGSSMSGQTGGFGWSSGGGWAAVTGYGAGSVGNSGLTYSNFIATGNDWATSASQSAISQNFASSYGGSSSGGTYWASALVDSLGTNPAGTVQLMGSSGSSGPILSFGFYEHNDFSLNVSKASYSLNTNVAPTQGDTYLVVFEVQYTTSGTTDVSMWVNPTVGGTTPTGAIASTSGSTTYVLPALTGVEIFGNTFGGQDSELWDEFRFGSTYASVAPAPVPAANVSITSLTANTNAVTVNFSDSNQTNVIGYDIWRSTTSGSGYTEVGSVTGATATSYTDSSVTSGITYYYVVTAYDNTGDSPNSAQASIVAGGAPNVPTGVTAIASGTASSIAVKWSESSTGTIDYNIQRSTNGTSGWSTVATGVTNTSYTDTTVSAGQTYYYEVEAYYAPSGANSAWSSSANAATMAAYEGFAYTIGNGQKWQAGNGGLGWSSVWNVGGTSDASIVAGLSYTSGSSALTTSGNAAQLIADQIASRTLASTVGTAGSTLWVSAEMNLHGSGTLGAEIDLGVYNGSTANDVRLGAPNSNGDIGAAVDIYPYNNSVSTSTSIVANTTYFVVYEIQYLTTGDVISVYADPTLVTQPSSASAVLTLPSTQQLKSTTQLTLNSNEINTDSQWDELRFGPTYASVTPDPVITNSGKKSSHSHKSSPFLSGAAATGKSPEILTASKPASANLNYFYSALNGGSWRWASAIVDDDNLLTAASNDAATGSWQGLFN